MDLERRSFLKKIYLLGLSITTVSAAKLIYAAKKNNHNPKRNNDEFVIVERQVFSMGTQGVMKVVTNNVDAAEVALDAAIERLTYLESKLTKFSKYSDIGQINLNQGVPVSVSKDTINILAFSLGLIPKTNHRFDIGMGDFLHRKGLDISVPKVGNERYFKVPEIYVEPVIMDHHYVTLARKNTMLDLGGVAKGYALDETMKILKEYGMKHAAIELGGDLIVLGGKGKHIPWIVGLDPKAHIKDKNKRFRLMSNALASSGGYLKKAVDQKGKIKHHIVDPKTLSSVGYYQLTTVEGPSALICDVLATSAFNTPPEELIQLRKTFPEYTIWVY